MTRTLLPELAADTKTALLDAAERLFAERGIAEASLRAITGAARANLASVNYHFGSKEGLVEAVFARRLRPLNRQRLELLKAATDPSTGAVDLTAILRAFVEPAVTMMLSEEPGDRDFVKLLGQALADPSGELRAMLLEEFREVIERFSSALAGTLPGLSPEEVAWRFHFMVGAMAHTVASGYLVRDRLEQLGLREVDRPEVTTERLVSFLESGWRGPTRRNPAPGSGDG